MNGNDCKKMSILEEIIQRCENVNVKGSILDITSYFSFHVSNF